MKINTSKKFILTAFINSLIILIVYAVAAFLYFNSVLTRYDTMASDEISQYAERLNEVNIEAIENITSKKNTDIIYTDLIDPRIDVILYKKRVDNTAEYNTRDDFLNKNKVGLTGILNEAHTEEIGGVSYMTYEFHYDGDYYIKLAMPYVDKGEYYIDYVISLVVLLLVAAVTCAVTSYMQGKPIVNNIIKQKEFVNDISHEIRTPLTVIKGNLENLLACPDSKVTDVAELVENSICEVEHITDLAENLLNIVSDNRNMVTKKLNYNLSDMVSNVLDVYGDIISGHNKTLIANIDSVSAICDTEKIKQLLIILLDNAIKYTQEGDRIKVALKRAENGFNLVVSDTGIGIDKGEEEKIFDRFYRGNNAKSLNGTGLGLSIAKSIVLSHEGKISATHNIPRGLVISVFIPNKK